MIASTDALMYKQTLTELVLCRTLYRLLLAGVIQNNAFCSIHIVIFLTMVVQLHLLNDGGAS